MMRNVRRTSWIVVSLALLSWCGCASEGVKSRPKLGKVKGTVTRKGKPIANAIVTFNMEGAPRSGSGVSDSEGKFQITTFDTNDGAIIGTHKVTLVKFDPDTGKQATNTTKPEDLGKIVGEKQFDNFMKNQVKKSAEIPEKYGNVKTTPLQYTIDPGDNEKNIDITD